MLFAYFGPETVLPLASVIATVFGVVMMFGRLSLKFALAPFQWVWNKARGGSKASTLRGPTAWRKGAAPARQADAVESRDEA